MTDSSRKRAAPLSLRLSENERARLSEWAGGQALSSYIKAVLFSELSPKMRSRSRFTAEDRRELAKILAWLGQTQIAAHLAVLANAAESGSLDMSEPMAQSVLKACTDIEYIRSTLMQALGKDAAPPPSCRKHFSKSAHPLERCS